MSGTIPCYSYDTCQFYIWLLYFYLDRFHYSTLLLLFITCLTYFHHVPAKTLLLHQSSQVHTNSKEQNQTPHLVTCQLHTTQNLTPLQTQSRFYQPTLLQNSNHDQSHQNRHQPTVTLLCSIQILYQKKFRKCQN